MYYFCSPCCLYSKAIEMKFKYCIAILSLILCLPLQNANAQKLKKAAESFLIDAVQLYNDGQIQESRAILSTVLSGDPGNDAAYYYAALCDLRLNKLEDAEKEFLEAIKLAPDNYWYKDRLATLYMLSGRADKTIELYEALIRDYPKKLELYYNLVNLYAQTGDFDKTIATLDEIEKMAGRDETTVLARYDILMHMSKWDEAIRVLNEFNEEGYPSPTVLSRLGDAMLSEDRDSLALDYYNEALTLDPSYVPALLGKADTYRFIGSYDEFFGTLDVFLKSPDIVPMVKTSYMSNLTQRMDGRFATEYMLQLDSLYETGLAQCPKDSAMLKTAAIYYFRSDRSDRGNELFKANAELYPDDYDAVALYVEALNVSEEWEQLSAACENAFARFPKEAAFLSLKSFADYQLKDFFAVIKDNEKMMEAFPKDKQVHLEAYSAIGDIYHVLGEEKLAYRAYDKALKIDPEYAPVLNNYAYYLSLSGKKLKKAYEMSRITIEKEPDNSTYLDTFAWILHLQGKDLEAKPFFKQAMIYGGKESVTVLDHYAEVLYALGEYELARVYWDMAKKQNSDNEIPNLDAKVESRMKSIKKK